MITGVIIMKMNTTEKISMIGDSLIIMFSTQFIMIEEPSMSTNVETIIEEHVEEVKEAIDSQLWIKEFTKIKF